MKKIIAISLCFIVTAALSYAACIHTPYKFISINSDRCIDHTAGIVFEFVENGERVPVVLTHNDAHRLYLELKELGYDKPKTEK